MANSFSAFWQTVVAAVTDASQLLAPTHEAINAIYVDYDPAEAVIGQTLNVLIPGDPSNQVTDLGTGDLPISDFSYTPTSIVFNHHPGHGLVVRDFEQFNSPLKIRSIIVDPQLKGIKNYVNNQITSLFTTGNFPTNTAITATAHIITTAQMLSGMTVLSDQFVPMSDPDDLSLIVPSQPYYAIVGDSNWTQALIAGQPIASAVRASGVMPSYSGYGATIRKDQQMPTSGAVGSRTYTAALMHRWAVALAARPIATPDTTVVEVMNVDFGGIPVRVMLGYNHVKLGYVLSVDCGFGLKVVRDNMAQLYTIAE